MAPIVEQKRNLRFLFLIIFLITIPCYCLGFVVLRVANQVKDIKPLDTQVVMPTRELPAETFTASLTPELLVTATLATQTITVTHTATVTKTRFLTPTSTATLTSTPTATATETPTATVTMTATITETPTPTATSTKLPFVISTPNPTPTEEE